MKKNSDLKKTAQKVRKNIISMSYSAQSAHMGGALSCVELLTVLYFKILTVFPKKPYHSNRDRFFFSKAHDAKALYATLAERGFFSKDVLKKYEQNNSHLPGHSTQHCIPGVEISAGSLGHGLSMAAGSAFALKLNNKNQRVFCMISDGECDEGSTWEAILFAGHHNLNNLIAIVDYNKLQGYGFTKDVLNLEPFAKKWKSFGWNTIEIKNGHDISQILKAFTMLNNSKPNVIIAHTIKGYKGIKKYINQISSQYKPPTEDEYNEIFKL